MSTLPFFPLNLPIVSVYLWNVHFQCWISWGIFGSITIPGDWLTFPWRLSCVPLESELLPEGREIERSNKHQKLYHWCLIKCAIFFPVSFNCSQSHLFNIEHGLTFIQFNSWILNIMINLNHYDLWLIIHNHFSYYLGHKSSSHSAEPSISMGMAVRLCLSSPGFINSLHHLPSLTCCPGPSWDSLSRRHNCIMLGFSPLGQTLLFSLSQALQLQPLPLYHCF